MQWCSCSKWKQHRRCSAAAAGGSNREEEVVLQVETTKMTYIVVLQQVTVAEKRKWCRNRWKQQSRNSGVVACRRKQER